MSVFKVTFFFLPHACRNQKESVNAYSHVFTCLRPDLVKAKLFMVPLNSLLKRSRAGNSHNNPHNGSERTAKRHPGHVRRETSVPLSSWKKIPSLVILYEEAWRVPFTRKSDLSQLVDTACSEQCMQSRGALRAVCWALLFAVEEFLAGNYLPPGWDQPVSY